nr:reverse transcriptase domain-containing protein [Tanacetum cinerariifolium]
MSVITDVRCALTQEALNVFCNTFHIPEEVHPVLPNQDETIHKRPAGKIREDHGTSSGTSVGSKSRSSLQRLLARAMLNAKVRVTAVPTFPFVTAYVSTMTERKDEDHMDFVAEPNLRTIGAPQRFVISSDSSYHFGPTITEAEVDSLVKSSTPIMTTATTVTFMVDSALVAKEKTVKPFLFFTDSSTAGRADPNASVFQILLAVISSMEHDHLFTEFNAGDARQMSLSADVRMRAEYNKSLRDEVNTLKERNNILEKEWNALDVKSANLEASAMDKERELTNLNVQLTNVKSQRISYENLTERLEEFQDAQLKIVNDKFDKLYADFVKMALHLEEKFYPHILTTISGRKWLLTYGMELFLVNCLHSPEYLFALGAAVGKDFKKGMQDGLSAWIIHGKKGRVLIDMAAHNPFAKVDYISALQQLQSVNFSLLSKLKSNKDASIETVMDILRLENPLAKKLGLTELSALRDVFVPLVEPFSAIVLMGLEGTSNVMPTTADTTTTLSTTLASASTITPISIDDYEVIDMDDQVGADGNAEPFPNVDDAELNIPQSTSAVFRVGMPISVGMTASVPYVNENRVSPLLDFIMVREMEPRSKLARAVTPPLRAASPRVHRRRERVVGFEKNQNIGEIKVGKNSEGGRPSEEAPRGNGSQNVNLPPLLAAHIGRNENGQPLQSSLTSAYRGQALPNNIGGNLPPNTHGLPSSNSDGKPPIGGSFENIPHGGHVPLTFTNGNILPKNGFTHPANIPSNSYPFYMQPMYAFPNMHAYANANPTGLFPNPLGSVTPFVRWIKDYPLLDGLKMPLHIGSYDRKGDPDNFLHLFEGAIRIHGWLMSVASHMFTYTLKNSARIWWNSQKAGRVAKWAIVLGEHEIEFKGKNSIKGQILADFLIETSSTKREEEKDGGAKKKEPEPENTWKLFTNEASSSDGSGAGLMLVNPEGKEYTYALRFEFETTNNEAEYEVLIAGLRIAKEMQIQELAICVDSQLVENQVKELFEARHQTIKQYREKTIGLMSSFPNYSIEHNKREQNKKADALNKLASMTFSKLAKEVLVEVIQTQSIVEKEIIDTVKEDEDSWMVPVREYMKKGILRKDPQKARKLHIKTPLYRMIEERLYRRSYMSLWLRCVGPMQAKSIIKEANGQVEVTNREIIKGMERRLGMAHQAWVDELPQVLWAHRTTPKSSNGETPFSLVYGSEVVIPIEISVETKRVQDFDSKENEKIRREDLDVLKERREMEVIKESHYKQKLKGYYNKNVKPSTFKPGIYVLRLNSVSKTEYQGKMGPT